MSDGDATKPEMGTAVVTRRRTWNRRVAVALVIAAMTAPEASAAQTYYARQKLAGMAGYTYAPVYSTSYSSCSGGTQSAPISGCRRSDGQSVATSSCSTSPQTTSRSCVQSKVCGDPTSSRAVSGASNVFPVGTIGSTGSWQDNIKATCNAYTSTYPTATNCQARLNRYGTTWSIYLIEGGQIGDSRDLNDAASPCQ